MAKVKVEGLTKIYGSNPEKALELVEQGFSKNEIIEKTGQAIGIKNISFEVAAGETFVVMGLSGSGKSTLVRCLNRLINPTMGTITIDTEEVTAMDEKELRLFRRHKQAGEVEILIYKL